MKPLFLFLTVFFLVSLTGSYCDKKQQNDQSESLSRKKRVIGIVLGAIALSEGRKNAADGAARDRAQRKRFCEANCVSEWTSWSSCTAECGGGRMSRTRSVQWPSGCSDINDKTCSKSLSAEANCNTHCHHGTRKEGGGCNCHPGRRGRCCDQAVTCSYPGRPSFGSIAVTTPAVYGAVADYSCDPGFYLRGETTLRCSATGTWSGEAPVCIALSCPNPNAVPNSRIITSAVDNNYHYGTEIGYVCDDGYYIEGSAMRRCGASHDGSRGVWTGLNPICLRVNCGNPGSPINGAVLGTNFKFGDVVRYECDNGYRRVGSDQRTCLASGDWSGNEAECEAITCPPPLAVRHGIFSPFQNTPYVFGSRITFHCEDGFLANGSLAYTCVEDDSGSSLLGGGEWDHEPPSCRAVVCGDPGQPEHGAKDGHIFHYPHNITFSCFAGYIIRGSHSIHCDSNGAWTAVTPRCEACTYGWYKADTERDSGCTQCPANTHTVTTASTSLEQCLCDEGYTGPPGGPCQEVRCGVLDPPEHGDVVTCDDSLHGVCHITCDEGYVLSRGSARRSCLEDGTWTGVNVSCEACPLNTYKSDDKSCLPCPRHSHTIDIAQSLTGCICDAGFRPSADNECTDIDECAANSGRGDCEDLCDNTEGSYNCDCSIQGYIIDPLDPHTCIANRTCRNLTSTDAPSHGGLVCHWYREQNSQQCSVRCNKGYEFPARTNNYETCGPSTGFMWSHEERDEIIEPCIEEFFPDFGLEAGTNYFVRACHDLTQEEQDEVKREFAEMLSNEGVCMKRETRVCDMKNVGIICGETITRRRRDLTLEEVAPVNLNLEVQALKLREKLTDCDGICSFLRIPASRCDALCERTFKRFLRATVMYSKRQLERLYANHNATRFVAANRTFDPSEEEPIDVSDVSADCPEGMVFTDDLCVPCVRGTYVAEDKTQCVKCQPGFYQPLAKQYDCLPCPVGSTSRLSGASSCTACEGGFYGLYCNSTCSECVYGKCNRVTGQCDCHSGWEGPSCQIDIPGCRAEGCYPGVVCEDIPAPGTGYSCGGCPHGYSGDGSFCVRDIAAISVLTEAPNR